MSDYVTREQMEQRLVEHGRTLEERTMARVDGALAGAAMVQEQRWAAIQTQLHTDIGTSVETAVGRAVQGLEQRLYAAEREGQELAGEVRELRHTVHGDPEERSGHPSIFEMFKSIEQSIQLLSGQIDLHDDRLDHLEGIEKAAVDVVRWLGKTAHNIIAARFTKFLAASVALVIKLTPLLVGAIASAVAAASFYMTFLSRIYQ